MNLPKTKVSRWDLGDRRLVIAYLVISVPTLLALCFLTGPFQVADEPSHFLRADGLSHGYVMPIVAPRGGAAGGFVDPAAKSMAEQLGNGLIDLDTNHRFLLRDLLPFWRQSASADLAFTQFSNTAIYFPIAHLLPAVAIGCARFLGAPPIAWFYVGRIVNAAAAIIVSAIAIALLGDGALFAFAIALLPMVLFQEASLSADCLVIACSILLGSLVLRLISSKGISGWTCIGLFFCLLYVCVAKFAYIPLAALPPMVSFLRGKSFRDCFVIVCVSISICAIWLLWTVAVQGKVFTIDAHDGVVDVSQQLMNVSARPVSFLVAFTKMIMGGAPTFLAQMVGRKLGWLNILLPVTTVLLALTTLLASYIFRGGLAVFSKSLGSFVAFLIAGSIFATSLLLYLQFTPVGKPTIDGFQGRYLIPLLPFVSLILPGMQSSIAWKNRLTYAVICVSALNGGVTVYTSWLNYWHPLS